MKFALTQNQLYALAAALGFGVLWLLNRKPAAGAASVELGTGTVGGVYGGDYTTPRDPANPAQDPKMYDLINESNAAIAAHPDQGAIL